MPARKDFVEWFTKKFPHSCIDSDHARSCLAGWNAAEENGSSHNSAMPKFCPYHRSGAQCIWGLRGCCKESLPCDVQAELHKFVRIINCDIHSNGSAGVSGSIDKTFIYKCKVHDKGDSGIIGSLETAFMREPLYEIKLSRRSYDAKRNK